MKKSVLLILGLVVLAAAVFIVIFTSLGRADQKTANASICTHSGAHHTVVIRNNAVLPEHTSGKLCDTLTITNQDAKIRLIAFGQHDHHTPYDGTTEKVLDKGQSLSITLDQPGNFLFHDHLDDSVQGTFTVL